MNVTIKGVKAQIQNLTEIVTKSKEIEKRSIVLDPTFIPPAFPCRSIVATRQLEEDCHNNVYCDQLVRFFYIFSNLPSEIECIFNLDVFVIYVSKSKIWEFYLNYCRTRWTIQTLSKNNQII